MQRDLKRPILQINELTLSIRTDAGIAHILDEVDLEVPRGKIVGVVGESGCGKSTLVRAILGVLPRSAGIDAGAMRFDGRDLLGPDREAVLREIRGQAIGFVPQDPLLAFNPVFKIGTQLMEIMRAHMPRKKRRALAAFRTRIVELLRLVQIPDPERMLERYPHQVSGGQRQRLLIAGALLLDPALLIADEPTTSLDVTTQREILRLLRGLTRRLGISMLFITHDFGVVAQLCDLVSVMYAGQIVETAPTRTLLDAPAHPYTRALLSCHPERSRELAGIPGSVPSPLRPPSGCRYRTRCSEANDRCAVRRPTGISLGERATVACTLYTGGARRDEEAKPLA